MAFPTEERQDRLVTSKGKRKEGRRNNSATALVKQQLMRMWLDANNAPMLQEIEEDTDADVAGAKVEANVLARAVEREATDAFTQSDDARCVYGHRIHESHS